MTSILNTIKSLAIGVIIFSFVMGVTLNSCTSNKKSENTEAASDSDEHPAAEEESTAGDEEHPSGGEEHPSDSTEQEHPTN